jgi:nitronate monooxygenase
MPDPSFLGSPLPLIQAPMAGAQDARLALAAGRAGALGSLPAAEVVRTLAAGFAA